MISVRRKRRVHLLRCVLIESANPANAELAKQQRASSSNSASVTESIVYFFYVDRVCVSREQRGLCVGNERTLTDSEQKKRETRQPLAADNSEGKKALFCDDFCGITERYPGGTDRQRLETSEDSSLLLDSGE